ncbi:MAG TPA: hypothetical protein VGN97_08475 [Mesorhizobium sp.]|nr:hypothetical protein [Mesorhizobium sp.]
MIKFALAAVWISLVTLGAVVLGLRAPADAGAEGQKPAPFMGGLDYVKTEIISVPVVRKGAVVGYFLGRFVYTAEPGKLARLSVPADILLSDAIYGELYGRHDINVAEIETFDIESFRTGLRDGINARVGETLVHDVMVEQVDFLTKDDIRNNSRRSSSEARNVRKSGGQGEDGHAAEDQGSSGH